MIFQQQTAMVGLNSGQEADPYWSNVVALLHLDGANGSSTFTDQRGHTFSAIGSATLSTAQSKFGGASLALNGTSQAIQAATSTDWEMGSGSFTIEAWVRPAIAVVARMDIFERWATYGFGLNIESTGFLRGYVTNTTSGSVLVGPGATTVTNGVWHHVALVRDGTTMRLFLDGVSQGTATFNGSIDSISETLSIGYDNGGSRWFNGNIDEVRITKGVARYTANFTPPAAPFPNS